MYGYQHVPRKTLRQNSPEQRQRAISSDLIDFTNANSLENLVWHTINNYRRLLNEMRWEKMGKKEVCTLIHTQTREFFFRSDKAKCAKSIFYLFLRLELVSCVYRTKWTFLARFLKVTLYTKILNLL